MNTNLLVEFNYNKSKGILASGDYYGAFKSKIEGYLQTKASIDPSILGAPTKPYAVQNGVAIIDFSGFMVSSASPLDELFFGVISVQDFCNDLQAAFDDPTVNQIVINFDSGGGYVTAYLIEASELIQTLSQNKQIFAYTSGFLCSAAYWIACSCSKIIASPSALVGNVGVFAEYLTYIGASPLSGSGLTVSEFPKLGFKISTFQSGTEKTVGSEFIDLTEDQQQSVLDEINQQGNDFRSLILANRGYVDTIYMEGKAYSGKEAMELNTNLIDGTVNSLNQFVQLISHSNN